MKSQKTFTEEALFDYYLVSSSEEEYVHCPKPFYMSPTCYQEMVEKSESMNAIALRILGQIQEKHRDLLPYIEDFPMKHHILGLKCPVAPMFWTRFDTFINEEDERIQFAEFNYDKPCAQKEIGLAGNQPFEGNINKDFEVHFKSQLISLCKDFRPEKDTWRVGVLMDPAHYEECHLAYYFKHLMEDTAVVIEQVGPKNLSVQGEEVYAFGERPIDVILRLYPTEYLYEVNEIEGILRLFEEGKVLIVNDPRVIAIQVKNFFAYLWKLVEEEDQRLTALERQQIRRCLPRTVCFKKEDVPYLLKNKNDYVLKPSFGRYSEAVYIGCLHTQEAWEEIVKEVVCSERIFILQEMIPIRQEYTYQVDRLDMTRPWTPYGNFGTYLIDKKVVGICVRWSQDFLTNNATTQMSSIGVKAYPVHLNTYEAKDRKALWDKVHERAIFEYGFTGGYYGSDEYISLDALILEESLYQEMQHASKKFIEILKKTQALMKEHFELFAPILGIPKSIRPLVREGYTDIFCAIGRIDFVMSQEGNLQILEFNAETPAGIVESIGLNQIIHEERAIQEANPNSYLKTKIQAILKSILGSFETRQTIETIAFVSCYYYEDMMTIDALAEMAKEQGNYQVVVGNIYDLEVRDDKVYLYGERIDAIYRHYPLDWFDEELEEIREVLNQTVYSINPTHTLITQSKALFAVMYSLLKEGFYEEAEAQFINAYIPYTCLVPDQTVSHDCIAKPYFSREGKGIEMSYEGITQGLESIIFQNRVDVMPLRVKRYTTMGETKMIQFPVMGMYIIGDEPEGIFTRIGGLVTDLSANFIPTYIQKNNE